MAEVVSGELVGPGTPGGGQGGVRGPARRILTAELVAELVAVAETGLAWTKAAEALGLDQSTVSQWRADGYRERAARARGEPPRAVRDQHVAMVDGMDAARARFERDALARLVEAAKGGHERRRVTTVARRVIRPGQDPTEVAEVIIDRTEVVEVSPPDPKVDEWRLERVIGGRYRRRDHLTHHVDPAELSAQWVEAFTATVADDTIGLSDEQRQLLREGVARRLREQVAAETLAEVSEG